MPAKKSASNKNFFEKFAHQATKATGSTPAFLIAVGVILVWGITGPIFGFSDTWQLVINTGTTIVTFLMVFLIQKTQNKDAIALHIKLNELIVATHQASNRIISVEDLTEDELMTLNRHYELLAELARKEKGIRETHSLKMAEHKHNRKHDTHKEEAMEAEKKPRK